MIFEFIKEETGLSNVGREIRLDHAAPSQVKEKPVLKISCNDPRTGCWSLGRQNRALSAKVGQVHTRTPWGSYLLPLFSFLLLLLLFCYCYCRPGHHEVHTFFPSSPSYYCSLRFCISGTEFHFRLASWNRNLLCGSNAKTRNMQGLQQE